MILSKLKSNKSRYIVPGYMYTLKHWNGRLHNINPTELFDLNVHERFILAKYNDNIKQRHNTFVKINECYKVNK